MQIRPCVPSDAQAIYPLICELQGDALPPLPFQRIFTEKCQGANTFYWMAEAENQAVGFISLTVDDVLHHAAKIGTVIELIVAAPCRRHGVASTLMETAAREAQNQGCSGWN